MISRGTVAANLRAWSSSLLRYIDLTVDVSGNLNVTGGGGGGGGTGDGALLDGVDGTIKASVWDAIGGASYFGQAQNPVAVVISDTAGGLKDLVPVTFGSGGDNFRIVASDGAAYTAMLTDPTGSESAMVVRNIPSGTQPVSGTVTADNIWDQTTAATASWTSGTAINTEISISPVGGGGIFIFRSSTTTTGGTVTFRGVDSQGNTCDIRTLQFNASTGFYSFPATYGLQAGSAPTPLTVVGSCAGFTSVKAVLTATIATGTANVSLEASSIPLPQLGLQPVIAIGKTGSVGTDQGSANTTVSQAWPIKVTDGTDVADVLPASTASVATDKALVVAVSPNTPIAATQSGTWTVQPGNTANSTPWLVDEASSSATGSAVPAQATFVAGSDGTNLQGFVAASAATLTVASAKNVQAVVPYAAWQISSRPASATKATATKSAGGAGVRHVVRGFSFSLGVVGTAQAAALQVDVIDGASGGTTRLWSGVLGGGVINSNQQIMVNDVCLIGTANTALTIEFSAAGATATVEACSLWGFSTT